MREKFVIKPVYIFEENCVNYMDKHIGSLSQRRDLCHSNIKDLYYLYKDCILIIKTLAVNSKINIKNIKFKR